MSSNIVRHLSPEEEELVRKREELSILQGELADREVELADLRTELRTFEGRYLRQVGVLYAQLDDWKAKVAELEARLDNSESTHQQAERARRQADNTYRASHGEASKAPDIIPSADLKSLFRKAAKQFHPDFAKDSTDEKRRHDVFIRAKEAFDRGDAQALQRLLDDNSDCNDSVNGEGIGAKLIRIIRQISQVRKKLSSIEQELLTLKASETAKLNQEVELAQLQGRDLLAELATFISEQVAHAREEYENLAVEVRTRGQ